MSNKQEHINEALGLAEKGLFHKDRIKEVIKSRFLQSKILAELALWT